MMDYSYEEDSKNPVFKISLKITLWAVFCCSYVLPDLLGIKKESEVLEAISIAIIELNGVLVFFPIFFAIGAYSAARESKDIPQAFLFVMASVVIAAILASLIIFSFMMTVISIYELDYDDVKHIMDGMIDSKTIILWLAAGGIGGLLGIPLSYEEEILEEEYSDSTSFIPSNQEVVPSEMVTDPRVGDIERRLKMVENKLNSERLTKLLYGSS
jgi:hypothetical protein